MAAAKTSKADKREAKKECRDLRGTDKATREAFKARVPQLRRVRLGEGSRGQGRTQEGQAQRRAGLPGRARRGCGQVQGHVPNFGKCVSERAKAKREEQDDDDAAEAEDQTNAAKECDAERAADSRRSRTSTGSNHNKRNAFGKCVSQKVHEDAEGEDDGS